MTPTSSPLFPEWFQKRIPFVRQAPDNPAYCAFRERRDRQGWFGSGLLAATGRRRPSSVGCLLALGLVFLLLIPVTLLSPFGSTFQTILFCVLALAFLFAAAVWMSNTASRRVPLRAVVAFNPQAPNSSVALDLWLCGITGRQIAEAILLEGLEKTAPINFFAQLLALAVFLMVLLAPAPLWAMITYGIVIALVCSANYRLALGAFPLGSANKIVLGLNTRWRRSESFLTRLQRDLPRLILESVITVASVIGVLIAISIIFRIVGLFVTNLPEGTPVWVWLQCLGVVFAVLSLFVAAAIVRIFKPPTAALLEKLLAQSDEAFEVYIRNELLKDPDALNSINIPETAERPPDG